eukprot:2977458-Alexandrium_andersonii.AAC.1
METGSCHESEGAPVRKPTWSHTPSPKLGPSFECASELTLLRYTSRVSLKGPWGGCRVQRGGHQSKTQ